MLRFLTEEVKNVVYKLDYSALSEIRLRVNSPLIACLNGKYQKINYPLGYSFDRNEMNKTIIRLTERTLYAHSDTIKKGYITSQEGERVGLCGSVVGGEGVLTIKNITSLCIRIPHNIENCSKIVYDEVFKNGLKSVLIISPPGMGKTTILKDLVVKLNDKAIVNILLIDEKLELSILKDRLTNVDYMCGCTKQFGLTTGIATMRPDLIVVDEITNSIETEAVTYANLSGVTVIATTHGNSLDDIKNKQIFNNIFDNQVFDYAVVLSNQIIGKIEKIIRLKNDI